MQPELSDHVAIVTGAGRGIGRSIALAIAAHGAHVMLAGRRAENLQRVAGEIQAAGGSATPVVTDLADEAQIVRLFEQTVRERGQLDILINNAGIGVFGPLVDVAAESLDQILRINVRGTFLCCREAMKRMVPRKAGTIINIASVLGFKGYANQSAYTASKHAVMGLTKSLAVEAQKDGIRVSAILPGGVDTEMVAESRPDLDRSVLLSPEDIAASVLYLLSLSDRAAVDQIYIRRRNSSPF